MEEFDDKVLSRAARAYRAYKRKEILKSMFSRYKKNRECFEDGKHRYFLFWLKALICILLHLERDFDCTDSTVVVCATDEYEGMEGSLDWISCEVAISPFVWGVYIYNDWD